MAVGIKQPLRIIDLKIHLLSNCEVYEAAKETISSILGHSHVKIGVFIFATYQVYVIVAHI